MKDSLLEITLSRISIIPESGLSNPASNLNAVVFPEPETVTGQISEELLKFFVGIKGVDKVTKLGSGLKGLYVNSAITSAVFFDPEEEWLANTLNEFESVAPFVPDILVSSENKDVFENRLAKALESTVLIAPFQIPALTKALGNVYSHLDNIRIAKLEQLKEEN